RLAQQCSILSHSIEAEKAMSLSYVGGSRALPEFELTLSAESKLDLLRKYSEIQSLADLPPGQLTLRATELERVWESQRSRVGADALASMLLPAFAAYAEAFDRIERSRRLVLTSLAVKQFQLANDGWPEQLQQLSQVGLSPEDWTLPGIGALGYGVEPDGKTACVWAVGERDKVNDRHVVASQCPDYAGEKMDDVGYYLIVIK
ncbi:MAG: hypothetical protein ABI557_17700, partial [Aureliella sp.]